MARDLPYVGVCFQSQINANSLYYKGMRLASYWGGLYQGLSSPLPSNLGTSIGGRTYSFTTRVGRTYELGRIEAGEARLQVNNSDGLFDPSNASSSFYPNLVPYRPVTINCAYPLTGNILNDTNLRSYVQNANSNSDGPYRISVGANDSNFELGTFSNWWNYAGSNLATVTTTAPHSGTYCMWMLAFSEVVLDVPVIPGKQITISLWYKNSTTSGNLNVQVCDVWTGFAYTPLSSTNAPNATTWTRYSVTVTPQTFNMALYLYGGGGTSNVYIDDVQVEFGATATTNVTTGPTIYPIFDGFIERYPQTFQAPNRGQAELVATDAIASLARNVMLSPYARQQVYALYYYPLSEGSSSIAAYNSSPYQQAPLTLYSSGGVTSVTFGDTDAQTGIPGAGTTNASLVYDATTGGTGLANVFVTDISWTANNDSYVFNLWYKYTGAPAAEYPLLLGSTLSNTNKPTFAVYLSGSGLRGAFTNTAGTTTYTGYLTPAAGVWNVFSFVVKFASSTGLYTITLGNSTPTSNTSVTATTGASATTSIAQLSLFGMAASLSYKAAHFSVSRDINTENGGLYLYGAKGYYGNSTGVRFYNVVQNISGMTYAPIDTQTGFSFMPTAVTADSSVADYLQMITDTEGGYWYVDGRGFIVFRDRHERLSKLVPSVTFGDGAGEIPYNGGDVVINFDPTYVLNDVTVNRSGGTIVQVTDDNSIVSYFPRSYSRTLQNLADSEVTDAAFFILSRYKDPHARPETITLTPARNPAIWPTALGLKIGDLVRIKKRPLGATMIQVDCFVERIEHNFDAQTGDWVIHVTVSPTIVYYWNMAPIRGATTGAAVAGSFVFAKNPTASVTAISGNGTTVTYTASNNFVAGQTVTIMGATTLAYNLSSAVIATASATQFTVTSTATGATSTATATITAGVQTPRDLIPGTMLQYTSGGVTYVDVVSGVPTETATTVTVPALRVGTISAGSQTLKISFITNDIPMDTVGGTYGLGNQALPGGAGTFLIDSEMVTASVVWPNFTISARKINSTTQTASGLTSASTSTISHLSGAPIYYVAGTSGGNVPTGTIVSQYLPNQIDFLPYSAGTYTAYDTAGILGSWTGTLNSATITKTTPASGIAYSTATMNALADRDNYPSQDLAVGQIFSFYNGSAVESLAAVAYGSPDTTTGAWTLTGYKVSDSGATLIARAPVSYRKNLCTNPSFEVSTASWTPVNATVARITTDGFAGTSCAELTCSGGVNPYISMQNLPVAPYQPYTLSAYFKVPAGQPNIAATVEVAWINASGTAISYLDSPSVTVTSASGWTRVSVSGAAPVGAATASIITYTNSTPAANSKYRVDAVMFENSDAPDRYFDGGNAGCTWDGTTGLSSSTFSNISINASANVTASALLIGNEFMQVVGGSGSDWLTVTRGTPDAAVWGVQSISSHSYGDKIYIVNNAALANTYATATAAIIEGYNVTTPVIGTARLGY